MNKHSFLPMIIATLILCSCAVTQFDRKYKLNKGEDFVINLKTNPSTGYIWTIEQGLSDSIVNLQGEKYIPDESPAVFILI